MTRGIGFGFLDGARPLDYGSRLARLRWRRAANADLQVEADGGASAAVLAQAQSWVLVADAAAVPPDAIPEPLPGRVSVARPARLAPGAVAHTLRELAFAPLSTASGPGVAVAFRTAAAAVGPTETIETIYRRLLASAGSGSADFPVFAPEEASEAERPEIVRRLPKGRLRILDAGCGAGGLGLARARNPGWKVVGIEKNPLLAARAREKGLEVREGDLVEILPRLAGGGETFDAIVFADVLEHLEEPVAALEQARRLVTKEGLLLVSVPNAGHLSIVRDLLVGRFDPVPSGLCDASHLRWFTRSSLADAVEEAGWRIESLEGEPGAPPPDAGDAVRLCEGMPGADPAALCVYQWIATARAR